MSIQKSHSKSSILGYHILRTPSCPGDPVPQPCSSLVTAGVADSCRINDDLLVIIWRVGSRKFRSSIFLGRWNLAVYFQASR